MPALAELATVLRGHGDATVAAHIPLDKLPVTGWHPASTPRRRNGESGRAFRTRRDEEARLRHNRNTAKAPRKPMQLHTIAEEDPRWATDVPVDGVLRPRYVAYAGAA